MAGPGKQMHAVEILLNSDPTLLSVCLAAFTASSSTYSNVNMPFSALVTDLNCLE